MPTTKVVAAKVVAATVVAATVVATHALILTTGRTTLASPAPTTQLSISAQLARLSLALDGTVNRWASFVTGLTM
jgi:hypothetical protein